jgi:hypothetical protein
VAHLEVKMTVEQQARAEMETALAEMAEEDRRRRHRREQKVKAMMQAKQGSVCVCYGYGEFACSVECLTHGS